MKFDVGAKVLLLMCNLKLHGSRKLRDRFVGPFVITEHFGATAYRLDLSLHAALHGQCTMCFMCHCYVTGTTMECMLTCLRL